MPRAHLTWSMTPRWSQKNHGLLKAVLLVTYNLSTVLSMYPVWHRKAPAPSFSFLCTDSAAFLLVEFLSQECQGKTKAMCCQLVQARKRDDWNAWSLNAPLFWPKPFTFLRFLRFYVYCLMILMILMSDVSRCLEMVSMLRFWSIQCLPWRALGWPGESAGDTEAWWIGGADLGADTNRGKYRKFTSHL